MKRRYPCKDMTKCQYQPQFGCWPGVGLAVGDVALAALYFAAGLAAGPSRTQRPTKQLRTTSKCGLAQGRVPAGQLGARRCSLAGPRARPNTPRTTKAASNSGKARAEASEPQGEDTTPMRNPRQGRGAISTAGACTAPAQGTHDKELQVHRFASYKFRVCRHG